MKRMARSDKSRQNRRAFEVIFLRSPTMEEFTASNEIVEQHGLPAFCRALLNANEFLFVSDLRVNFSTAVIIAESMGATERCRVGKRGQSL